MPRQVIPDSFYMLTRRCAQRQFLLRPDGVTNDTFLYCLAEAAQRFNIDVLLPSVMSNHHHTVVYDRCGTIVEFMAHFHKMCAKAQNAHRGRWENLWSTEPPCLVRLLEPSDVMDKLVYAATNPVKDGLVERVHHWPGVNGLSALLNDRPMVIRRPRQFFREGGPMPETVCLELVIPPALGDAAAFREELRRRVATEEIRIADARRSSGRRVLGRRAVLRQDWRACPSTDAPRRGIRPRIAARSRWARVEALHAYSKPSTISLRTPLSLLTQYVKRFDTSTPGVDRGLQLRLGHPGPVLDAGTAGRLVQFGLRPASS